MAPFLPVQEWGSLPSWPSWAQVSTAFSDGLSGHLVWWKSYTTLSKGRG
jgi:hypothetical protein